MKKKTAAKDQNTARFDFSEDEKKYPWLSMLFDAYLVVDRGIDLWGRREKRKRNTRIACREGCDVCCRANTDIPVYPLELAGLYWYAVEKTTPPVRDAVRENLSRSGKTAPCPFLLGNKCSVYPVRPAACRQYTVFSKPCAEGEDPYYTRRSDVLTPPSSIMDEAFMIMMPFYGITRPEEKASAVKNRVLDTRVQNLMEMNWEPLLKLMSEFDSKNEAARQ